MITIEKTNIIFQNERGQTAEPLPIIQKKLISGFVCPKCNKILLAYFETDEYIPVWAYEGEKGKSQGNEKDKSEYNVFHINGYMGIEAKQHIVSTYTYGGYSYGGGSQEKKSCNLNVYETYNPTDAINGIFESMEKKENEYVYDEKKRVDLGRITSVNDKGIEYLKTLSGATVIKNVCENNPEIMVSFTIDEFTQTIPQKDTIDSYKLEYGSEEYKKAEKKNETIKGDNKKARIKAYIQIFNNFKKLSIA